VADLARREGERGEGLVTLERTRDRLEPILTCTVNMEKSPGKSPLGEDTEDAKGQEFSADPNEVCMCVYVFMNAYTM
jgi:hypothetical protein